MMQKSLPVVGRRLLPLVLSAAAAMVSADEIENLVVVGSRLENSISSMPTHVTVIDRQLLDELQAQSVLGVLRQVAGVHVTQYGGRGGVSSVFVRGGEPNFTVVLIDGVKVNDPNDTRGGSFDFSTLNLVEIERIEIARGALSAVYGSDGLAGTINVITRKTADVHGAVIEGELGEDGFARGSVHASGPLGQQAAFSLSASGVDDGDAIVGNGFRDTNVTGRLQMNPTPSLTIDLSGRYSDANSRSFPEDSGGAQFAVLDAVDRRDQVRRIFSGALTYAMSDALTLNLQAGYGKHRAENTSPGVVSGIRQGVPPNESDSTLERFNIGTNLVYAVSDHIEATIGLDFEKEDGEQRGSLEFAPGFAVPTDFALDRDLFGVFAEVQLHNETGFGATVAVRHDQPSERGSTTSGRIGMQYQFASSRLFMTWSEGYKLPSFFALGHGLVGNPDLRPESSTSLEVGYSQSAWQDRLRVTVAAFDNDYEDLVDFDSDLFTNVNRNKVRIRGAEVALNVDVAEGLSFAAQATNMDIDVSGGTKLRQRPSWRGGLSSRWQVSDAVSAAIDWSYVGETFDSSIPTGDDNLDGYDRVGLEAAWQPRPELRVWIAVDNLLDADYEEAIGFSALERRVRLGVRYRL